MANLTSCRKSNECVHLIKKLAAFDFDLTIVDENTDTEIVDLLPPEMVDDEVKKLYKLYGWTAYMQEIFKIVHSINIRERVIKNKIDEIPEVNGISDLLKFLKENNYDVIIISDSNSYFINSWLCYHKLNENVDAVFTNSAYFLDNGLLKIEPFEHQTECKLSASNMCKGNILDKFVQAQCSNNINYSQIIYVGDGSNDFCPMLRLKEKDIAFPRAGFSCIRKIRKQKKARKYSKNNVKASVVPWKDANDILNKIRNDI